MPHARAPPNLGIELGGTMGAVWYQADLSSFQLSLPVSSGQ